MNQRRILGALLAWCCLGLIATCGPLGHASAADQAAKVDEGKATGILVDLKESWILVKADGEDEPVKYTIDTSDKKLVAERSGVLIPHRVQLTYKTSGDTRQLASIKAQHMPKASGSVTGVVVKHYGWWIEIQPKKGLAEGYALNFGEKNADLLAKFKELQAGDSATLKFTTDLERHRIQSIHKLPAAEHQDKSATESHKSSTEPHKAAKDAGKAAGILIDRKDDWLNVKADGEDEPVKYLVAAGDKHLQDTLKGVFNACRVQLTYKTEGDARHLVGIKRQILKANGSVTGDVVKVYNDFWVEVKPKKGLSDAYAPGGNFSDKEFMARLKGLQAGDSVTIVFTTDFERHRITSLKVNAPKPAKTDSAPPSTARP